MFSVLFSDICQVHTKSLSNPKEVSVIVITRWLMNLAAATESRWKYVWKNWLGALFKDATHITQGIRCVDMDTVCAHEHTHCCCYWWFHPFFIMRFQANFESDAWNELSEMS